MAFGKGIPTEVKSSIVSHYNVQELKFNGRSIVELFPEGSMKILLITTSDETVHSPDSFLTAQILQQAAKGGNHVLVVQFTNRELEEAGQVDLSFSDCKMHVPLPH